MRERRKDPRYKLRQPVRVWDVGTAQDIGRVVNINTAGMLLGSDTALELNKVYSFRMDLPQKVKGCHAINVTADSLWIAESDVEDEYWTGFQFVNTLQDELRCLERLIAKFSFKAV